MPQFWLQVIVMVLTALTVGAAPAYILAHPKTPDDPTLRRALTAVTIGGLLSGGAWLAIGLAVLDNPAICWGWAVGVVLAVVGVLALAGTTFARMW